MQQMLFFSVKQNGIGRRPGKHAEPTCEKPWFASNNDLQESRLTKKKDNHVKISKSYGHKVSYDNGERMQNFRLYSNNYRQNWIVKSCDSKSKQVDCQITESSDNEYNTVKTYEAPSTQIVLHVDPIAKKNTS